MSLLDQVYEAGTPRRTKADVVSYYQEKYPGLGKGGWKQHIISDLLGSQDITRGSVGDEEYKRLTKNTAKRFEKRLYDEKGNVKEEPRNAAQYRELGAALPPIPPEGRGHISGTIWVKYSDECVDREVDIDLSAKDVRRLFDMAEKDMIQAIANGYQSNKPGDTNIDFKGPSWCAPDELEFEMIEE